MYRCVPLRVDTIIGCRVKVGLIPNFLLGARFTITVTGIVAYIHRTPPQARSVEGLKSKCYREGPQVVEAHGLGEYICDMIMRADVQKVQNDPLADEMVISPAETRLRM